MPEPTEGETLIYVTTPQGVTRVPVADMARATAGGHARRRHARPPPARARPRGLARAAPRARAARRPAAAAREGGAQRRRDPARRRRPRARERRRRAPGARAHLARARPARRSRGHRARARRRRVRAHALPPRARASASRWSSRSSARTGARAPLQRTCAQPARAPHPSPGTRWPPALPAGAGEGHALSGTAWRDANSRPPPLLRGRACCRRESRRGWGHARVGPSRWGWRPISDARSQRWAKNSLPLASWAARLAAQRRMSSSAEASARGPPSMPSIFGVKNDLDVPRVGLVAVRRGPSTRAARRRGAAGGARGWRRSGPSPRSMPCRASAGRSSCAQRGVEDLAVAQRGIEHELARGRRELRVLRRRRAPRASRPRTASSTDGEERPSSPPTSRDRPPRRRRRARRPRGSGPRPRGAIAQSLPQPMYASAALLRLGAHRRVAPRVARKPEHRPAQRARLVGLVLLRLPAELASDRRVELARVRLDLGAQRVVEEPVARLRRRSPSAPRRPPARRRARAAPRPRGRPSSASSRASTPRAGSRRRRSSRASMSFGRPVLRSFARSAGASAKR